MIKIKEVVGIQRIMWCWRWYSPSRFEDKSSSRRM